MSAESQGPYRSKCAECDVLRQALLATKEELASEERVRALEKEAATELIKKLETEKKSAKRMAFAEWVSDNGGGLVIAAIVLVGLAIALWATKALIGRYMPPDGPCHDSAELIHENSPPHICSLDATVTTERVDGHVLVRCTCPAPTAPRPR